MIKNDMIAKNDFISIEVGAKKYDVSNSGNHLFICENDCTRITQTTSIVEELRNKMVEVWLLSSEPNKYKKAVEA
ncbi:MAG: hypothetical protein J6Q85_02630 [Clostridia bacterium]|nr:hypothetical protein [Clostridia bacterium]